MIDFHSHILPGIDDGSQTVEESIALLQMEKEQGITHVVATPHFYPRYDKPDAFLARRDRAEEQLRRKMQEYPGLPHISVGAEVYYFRGISDSDLITQLTIRDKSCIIIEMPHIPWPDSAFEEFKQIYHRWGIVPVIAHIDRYIRPFKSYGIPKKLSQLPVLVQANADFFLQHPSMAMRMLKRDQIHLLGSDCHDLSSRKPNLQEALDVIRANRGDAEIQRISQLGKSILEL